MSACSDCDRKTVARGLCAKHYQSRTKAGTLPPKPPRRTSCEVEGCEKPGPFRLGYCYVHHQRLAKYGRLHPLTVDERFDAKWKLDPETGCHIWTGASHPLGYGHFNAGGGRYVKAHKYAWERKYGPALAGMVFDHFVCENPPCCNPDHVRPVTTRENNLRGRSPITARAYGRTCVRGHPWSPENEYWRPDGHGRQCRECIRLRTRASGQRGKASQQ